MATDKVEVKIDESNGLPYVWMTKTVHGEEIKVKVYGEQGKRPKKYVR